MAADPCVVRIAETRVSQPNGDAQSFNCRCHGTRPCEGSRTAKTLDSDGRLAEHHRLDAVRTHLLEMLGDHESAVEHYRAAAGRTTSIPERNYLMTQAARLEEGPRGSGEKTTVP